MRGEVRYGSVADLMVTHQARIQADMRAGTLLELIARADLQSYSSSFPFGAPMAERDSKRTGFLSQGTRGTLERSRDGLYTRLVF